MVGFYSMPTTSTSPLNEEVQPSTPPNHEAITYRVRSGEVSHIPQAERYSTKDWLHNLLTLPTSRLLKRIRGIVFLNFMWSIAVVMLNIRFKFTTAGSKCHGLLGSVLGLLLVFRTNTAYNRFWEGRRLWERVLSLSRDMSRFALVFGDVIGKVRVERLLHLVCSFPIALHEHVQGFHDKGALLAHLSEDEVATMARVTNKPLFVCAKLAFEVRSVAECARFSPRERQIMLKYVDDLSDLVGACERIVQTPVPLSYARHTSRFLSLFCLTAPVALVQELSWGVVPFVTLMSWSLFGIQEIGMMIEDPFQGALRLEVFANTIRRDVSDMLHIMHICPEPLEITAPALGYEVPFYCRIEPTDAAADSN